MHSIMETKLFGSDIVQNELFYHNTKRFEMLRIFFYKYISIKVAEHIVDTINQYFSQLILKFRKMKV